MRKLWKLFVVGQYSGDDQSSNSKDNKELIRHDLLQPSIVTNLSQDIISNQIIPHFDAKALISFAGVCSEWRRIVKLTHVRGVTCSSVQYSFSNLTFQTLTEKQMSGLIEGDLNEIFSEFSIVDKLAPLGRSLFKRLFNSKKIESLTLISTNVITKDIPSCSPLLTSLKLIRVVMNTENLKTICNRLENLTELTLIENNIDKKAGSILANSKLKNLTHLVIGNNIGNEGARHLFSSNQLRNLKKIEFVRHGDPFRNSGNVQYIPPIDSSKFPALDSFTSAYQFFSKEGIMNVLNSGISWKELTFGGYFSFDDDCLSQVGKLTSLEKFCLKDSGTSISRIHSTSYRHLSSLQTINRLEISVDNDGLLELCNMESNDLKHFCNYESINTYITEKVMKKFCDKFQRLTFLKLVDTALEPGCVYHVSKLPNLRDLHLQDTNADTESIKHISTMTKLQSLTLDCDISSEGMSYLCQGALMNLTSLKLSSFRQFDETDAACLSASHFPKLIHLSIRMRITNNKFLDVFASGSSFKHLTHLELLANGCKEETLLAIMNNYSPQYLTILKDRFMDYKEVRKKTTSKTKLVMHEAKHAEFIPYPSSFISHQV